MSNSDIFLSYLAENDFTDLPETISVNEYVPLNDNQIVFLADNGIGLGWDYKRPGNRFEFCPRWQGRELSETEFKKKQDAIKEAYKLADQIKTALDCQQKWESFSPADPEHPYLKRKGIKSYGLKQTTWKGYPSLVIPLGNNSGIQTFEYILPDKVLGCPSRRRDKDLEPGKKVEGCWFQIGEGTPRYLCEGYATGASVYEATGKAVIMAYSSGNIPNVAEFFPQTVCVADNDNAGIEGANKAHELYGNPVIVIPEGDANDYAQAHSLQALRESIEKASMFRRGDSLLDLSDSESWLIENWIPQGKGLYELYSQSGSGKTFLILDWCLSLCCGLSDWFGNRIKDGGARIVYCAGEGLRGVSKRIRFWVQEHGGLETNRTLIGKNLLYLNRKGTLSLDNEIALKNMIGQIESEEFRPDLIVWDTLNRFSGGADENSTKDMTGLINSCDSMAEHFDCGVLLVHHTGWSQDAQKRGRGSSTIRASVDMDFCLEKKTDGSIVLSQEKCKDNEPQKPMYFKLSGGTINGESVRSAILIQIDEPEERKTQRQIDDESLFTFACREYGYLDSENWVCILRKNLISYIDGKILDSEKKPITSKTKGGKTRLNNEVNPKQKKLMSRLLSYGFCEVIQEGDEVKGFKLTADIGVNTSVRNYLRQQGELDL